MVQQFITEMQVLGNEASHLMDGFNAYVLT
jgi:hypothetical protein